MASGSATILLVHKGSFVSRSSIPHQQFIQSNELSRAVSELTREEQSASRSDFQPLPRLLPTIVTMDDIMRFQNGPVWAMLRAEGQTLLVFPDKETAGRSQWQIFFHVELGRNCCRCQGRHCCQLHCRSFNDIATERIWRLIMFNGLVKLASTNPSSRCTGVLFAI